MACHYHRDWPSHRCVQYLLLHDATASISNSFLLGSSHLGNEVGRIVECTIEWIENDMARKIEGAPPLPEHSQPKLLVKHEIGLLEAQSQSHAGDGSATNGDKLGDSSVPRVGDVAGYYKSSVPASQAADFEQLAFQAQPAVTSASGGGGVAYGPNDGANYLYVAPPGPASVGHPSTGSQASLSPANPLAAFGGQPTHQTDGGFMAGGNPWHAWAAAIANLGVTHHRDLALGNGPGVDTVTGDLGVEAGIIPSQAGQWPLLLFHDVTGTGGGLPKTEPMN